MCSRVHMQFSFIYFVIPNLLSRDIHAKTCPVPVCLHGTGPNRNWSDPEPARLRGSRVIGGPKQTNLTVSQFRRAPKMGYKGSHFGHPLHRKTAFQIQRVQFLYVEHVEMIRSISEPYSEI